MEQGVDPYGLEGRKRTINECMERFRRLRRAGRFDEAVIELRMASRLAGESVEHTLDMAGKLLTRLEKLYGDIPGGDNRPD